MDLVEKCTLCAKRLLANHNIVTCDGECAGPTKCHKECMVSRELETCDYLGSTEYDVLGTWRCDACPRETSPIFSDVTIDELTVHGTLRGQRDLWVRLKERIGSRGAKKIVRRIAYGRQDQRRPPGVVIMLLQKLYHIESIYSIPLMKRDACVIADIILQNYAIHISLSEEDREV